MDVKYLANFGLNKERAWALYNYGGIYLDSDIFVRSSIDELKSFFHALPSVDSVEYNEFSKNSKNMLSFFSPKIVSEQLQEQL